jgi:hypothetical protein
MEKVVDKQHCPLLDLIEGTIAPIKDPLGSVRNGRFQQLGQRLKIDHFQQVVVALAIVICIGIGIGTYPGCVSSSSSSAGYDRGGNKRA